MKKLFLQKIFPKKSGVVSWWGLASEFLRWTNCDVVWFAHSQQSELRLSRRAAKNKKENKDAKKKPDDALENQMKMMKSYFDKMKNELDAKMTMSQMRKENKSEISDTDSEETSWGRLKSFFNAKYEDFDESIKLKNIYNKSILNNNTIISNTKHTFLFINFAVLFKNYTFISLYTC